eukprot:643179-Prymnesium_polylepis.3
MAHKRLQLHQTAIATSRRARVASTTRLLHRGGSRARHRPPCLARRPGRRLLPFAFCGRPCMTSRQPDWGLAAPRGAWRPRRRQTHPRPPSPSPSGRLLLPQPLPGSAAATRVRMRRHPVHLRVPAPRAGRPN